MLLYILIVTRKSRSCTRLRTSRSAQMGDLLYGFAVGLLQPEMPFSQSSHLSELHSVWTANLEYGVAGSQQSGKSLPSKKAFRSENAASWCLMKTTKNTGGGLATNEQGMCLKFQSLRPTSPTRYIHQSLPQQLNSLRLSDVWQVSIMSLSPLESLHPWDGLQHGFFGSFPPARRSCLWYLAKDAVFEHVGLGLHHLDSGYFQLDCMSLAQAPVTSLACMQHGVCP